jgi:hypothetical protein
VNLGDWMEYNTYFSIDENGAELKSYTDETANYVYQK